MKKTYLIVLIAVAVILLSAVIFVSKPWQWLPNLFIEKITTIRITEKKITENTKPFKIDVVYPQASRLNDLNKKIETLIKKEIADFKENALANDESVKQIDPESYAAYPREYDINIDYDKGQTDEKIVSFVFNVYNFEGGAHGAGYFIPVNYNVQTKLDITLAELFPNAPDYLQKISDYCINDLTKQVTTNLGGTDGTWIKEGAGPDENNFTTFLINPDNTITFYFPRYQIAFGAAGDFKVTMPR